MPTRDPQEPIALIPAEWRDAVRRVLRSRAKDRIIVTTRAQHEWDMAFPNGYPWDLLNALEAAFADAGLTGRRIADIRPPGEAYEFMFRREGKTLYGKVSLLLPERRVVLVVSAHTPNKGDSL